MIPHHIYVQGSYIDIHDCVTVNLSCNGAEVHVEKKPAADAPAPETENPESSDIGAHLTHFTDDQVKGSGIRVKPREALALMEVMRPQCTQKISWLMFYCVLLRRGWVDANVRAYCRLVATVFNVGLDPHNLSKMLAQHGSDYTKWTEADIRIKAHKALATDFDRRLTEYFVRKRAEVMEGVRQVSPCFPYE